MIISVSGGLGNQMFQYAYFLAQTLRYPSEVVQIDLSSYKTNASHNGFELKRIFDIDVPECPQKLSEKNQPSSNIVFRFLRKMGVYYAGYKYKVRDKGEGFDKKFLGKFATDDYLYGFWQCEKYFRDYREKVKDSFSFPEYEDDENRELATTMRSIESVAVHVRRGDYLKYKMYVNLGDIGYYHRAIQEVKNASMTPKNWFVFSDDIQWCKDNLDFGKENVVYVSNNQGENSFRDMQLMTECKYLIVANSSFSWWGAYLNNRVDMVIAPKEYYVNNPGFNRDICPETWIRV